MNKVRTELLACNGLSEKMSTLRVMTSLMQQTGSGSQYFPSDFPKCIHPVTPVTCSVLQGNNPSNTMFQQCNKQCTADGVTHCTDALWDRTQKQWRHNWRMATSRPAFSSRCQKAVEANQRHNKTEQRASKITTSTKVSNYMECLQELSSSRMRCAERDVITRFFRVFAG